MKLTGDPKGYEKVEGAKYDDVDKSRSQRRMRIQGYDDPPLAPMDQEAAFGDSQPEEGGFLRRNNIMERN